MPELGPIAPKVTGSSLALRDTPTGDLEFDRHLDAGSPVPTGEEPLPRDPVYEHIITKLGKRDFLNARSVSQAWKGEIDRQRHATLQFMDEIRRVTNGQDPQPAGVALGLLSAIRDNLDDLTRGELTEIASFVKNLTDEAFVDALSYLGPGVQHFSLAQQSVVLDRAEQLWRRRDTSLDERDWSNAEKVQIGTLRLVPHLSEGPRRRAFDFFLAQVEPVAREAALEEVAEQSDRMSTGELNAAVDIVVNPDDAFHQADEEDWAKAVAALGGARNLTGQHRDRLLATAQGFKSDDNFSLACAGILDGASWSAGWPGPQRLEALVDRAEGMQTPAKVRLMAAICSAARGGAPQRAVDVLKGLVADPQNEELHGYLFKNLNRFVSPVANMSAADKEHVITGVLNYDAASAEVARARTVAIVRALPRFDVLSLAPIDRRVYDTALRLRNVYAIARLARHIGGLLQDAELATDARLAEWASNLVGEALLHGSGFLRGSFGHVDSPGGLEKVLPGLSDQQRKQLVDDVVALEEDDANRTPIIISLLRSRTVLGRDLTEDLLKGLRPKKAASAQPAHETGPAME